MAEPTFPDPWSINYFDPPKPAGQTPGVRAPSLTPKIPKSVPEIDDLFRVQRDALKVLNKLDDLEDELGDALKKSKVFHALKQEAQNTYRVIRSYLEAHAT